MSTVVAHSISDARFSTGTPHFYFLPPIQPATDYDGTFDGSHEPVVEICERTGGSCGPVLRTFSRGDGLSVHESDEHYRASWNTAEDEVEAGRTYRIRVLLDGVELGHADAKVEANGRGLKDVDGGSFVGVVRNRTLPIKFRLEEGLAVLGARGGELRSADGKVAVAVPEGSLEEDVAVTVVPVPDPPEDPGLVPGSAYDFGPDGTEFARAVTIEIAFDPAQLPAGVAAPRLRLHKRIGEMWREVPGSSVDLAANKVSGLVNGFSEYAVAASPGMFAGDEHTCSIDVGGVVRCWGRNLEGELGTGTGIEFSAQPVEVAAAAGQFATLTAGAFHTCGLTEDGTAHCWGWNGFGQLGTGDHTNRNTPTPVATAERFKAISGGGRHTCALTLGDEVFCWGGNFAGQIGIGPAGDGTPDELVPVAAAPPSGVTFKSVTTGGFHTCALAQDATAYCWGENRNGQLGGGAGLDRRVGVPTAVAGGRQFGDISGATEHTCAVTLADEGYCWGRNRFGELGIGGASGPVPEPTPVATSLTFLAVGGGERTSCGITGDGDAYCWGDNWYGTLGTGDWEGSAVPRPVAGGLVFKSIREGRQHVCGIALTGEAYCWGHDGPGMLGNGTTSNVITPSLVEGSHAWSELAGGHHHTCGLDTGGTAHCWGRNLAGSLGNDAEDIPFPTPVEGGLTFVTLDTHHNLHTCGIAGPGPAGPAYCWGSNLHGQLGTGDFFDQPTPTLVGGGHQFVQIVTGGIQNQPGPPGAWSAFTCGLDEAGAAWCWGSGHDGRLGNGGNSGSPDPVAVAGGHVFAEISLGADFACARKDNGEVWCWGDNTSGELADGTTTPRNVPGLAAGGQTFSSISAGGHVMCALDASDQAWCWGFGGRGQIGNGDWATQRDGPVQVSGGLKFAQISVGQFHVCGVTLDGTLYCWGWNSRGQIGNNSLFDVNEPTAVDTPLQFRSVEAVWIHTCAITADESAYCWGHKGGGRLGDGQVAYHNAPQEVLGDATFASASTAVWAAYTWNGVGPSASRPSGPAMEGCGASGECDVRSEH